MKDCFNGVFFIKQRKRTTQGIFSRVQPVVLHMFGPKKWWVDFSTVTYLSATLRIQANCSALIAMQDNEYHRTILASRGSSDYEDFMDSDVPSLLEFLRNCFTFELRLRSKKIQKVIITLEMMENAGNSYCNLLVFVPGTLITFQNEETTILLLCR